jgi:hypothetical protein
MEHSTCSDMASTLVAAGLDMASTLVEVGLDTLDMAKPKDLHMLLQVPSCLVLVLFLSSH